MALEADSRSAGLDLTHTQQLRLRRNGALFCINRGYLVSYEDTEGRDRMFSVYAPRRTKVILARLSAAEWTMPVGDPNEITVARYQFRPSMIGEKVLVGEQYSITLAGGDSTWMEVEIESGRRIGYAYKVRPPSPRLLLAQIMAQPRRRRR